MSQAKTQDIIPESGLGPQNSQWRRWVETSITNMKRGFTAFKADIANSFKAVSSSMELLSTQMLQNRQYSIFDSGSKVFYGEPGALYPPQDGGSVTFTATGATLLVTMSVTGDITQSGPSAAYWEYTVKVPGVLPAAPVYSGGGRAGNLIGGGFFSDSYNTPFAASQSFILTVPTPGSYTMTAEIRGLGNTMYGTVTLDLASAVTIVQNL